MFLQIFNGFVSSNQSTDQPLMEVDGMASGGRGMYSSNSTLARSQYPTHPVGAMAAGASWTGGPYPSLARSISHRSQGAQSDSVFLDGEVGAEDPPASPGRYCQDPTFPNGFPEGDVETDGEGHSPFSSTLPRRTHKQPGKCVCVCMSNVFCGLVLNLAKVTHSILTITLLIEIPD